MSPSRSSYSVGLVYASKNGDSLLTSPADLDGIGSADLSRVPADSKGPLPQFLIVLGGSGQAPSTVDVKLSWTGVADPKCTGGAAPAPTLKVITHVAGGTATAGQWSAHVQNASHAEVAGSPQPGSETGTTYTLSPGAFSVSETGGASGYTMAASGDCDASGNVTLADGDQKTCTLTNTYVDRTAPVLHGPGNLTATATSRAGAIVSYDVTATDPDDPVITVHCSSSPSGMSSGSTFPIGTTGIHCTASDAAGNAAAPLDFAVTVLDPAPFVTVPVSIDDSTSDPNGKTESFAVSATDYLDGTLLASCDHASGSTFPVGATTVLCSATNSSHLITTASFTVTIRYIDATPPVLHGPGDVTATATASTGAAVPFTVTAADPDDAPGVLALACDHASGATFSIGVTTVTCHAHDPAGNEAQPLSFTVTVGDAPPLLWLPGDISATTNARGGKVETFAISATDFADGSVPVVCDHASGDVFPVGITTVHCHATNRSGQTTSGSFTVSVTYVDVTPPVFHAPVDLTATATSPAGAAVPFAVTATDPDDDAVTILCDHPSGATFQIGVTTVTCHAHDAAGNEAQPASFSVTVNDAAPILSLPHDIHDTTNDPSGKEETFSATASDFGDGSVLVVCDHASGATFPVGTTTVQCGALNGAGKSAVGSFSVTVAYVDATAPVLHGPGDLSATATSSSGATVSFGVTASDPDDDAPTVACDHASGATFPIGLTTVTCHAHDPAGNEAQPLSFGVTVSDAAPALSLPADISDTAHVRSGKVATFAASATDFGDGPLPVACDHASGEAFPVGATTVHCHATNSSGRTTSGSFTVTIAYVDVTPPSIKGPGDRTATATSSNGAVVSFAVTATDPDDDAPAVACDRASGATFPIGVTTVTCHAHDPAGNEAQPLRASPSP